MAIFLCFGIENDILRNISTTPSADGNDKDNLSAMITFSSFFRTMHVPLIGLCLLFSPIWDVNAQNQAAETPEEFWGRDDAFSVKAPVERILVLGDSLMNGYGLDNPSDSVVEILRSEKYKRSVIAGEYVVKDMSHAGDTSSTTLSRVRHAIITKPDIVILAIGGNDALRGVDPDILYNNLNATLKELTRAGIYTLLVGMQATPSMGYTYMSKFNSVYAKLAERHPVVFMPFLLKDVVGNYDYNQADGIHPNKKGTQVVAKNLSYYLKRMVNRIRDQKHKLRIQKMKDDRAAVFEEHKRKKQRALQLKKLQNQNRQ